MTSTVAAWTIRCSVVKLKDLIFALHKMCTKLAVDLVQMYGNVMLLSV